MNLKKLDQELLLQAVQSRNIEQIREILSCNAELCRSSGCNSDSVSPMWSAMLAGHEEIVELLVEFGADVNEWVNAKDDTEESLTFFHVIALEDNWPKEMKIAEILIKNGADVNACSDLTSRLPIQIAMHQGKTDYVEFLLKNGAKLDGPEWKGNSPMTNLTLAPIAGKKEMLLLLIKYGLDLKFHNNKGRNLLHIFVDIVKNDYSEATEIMEILLDAGVPLDDVDNFGYSPLCHSIILKRNVELIHYLIKKGADVNIKCAEQPYSPLILAAVTNDQNVVDLLLSNGANVNEKTKAGWTALHAACLHNREETISFLIKNGAEIRVEDDEGATPLSSLDFGKENYDRCCIVMIKELAKLAFENHLVPEKDKFSIQNGLVTKEHFDKCTQELRQMSETKFYPPYSYYHTVLETKSIKKLANLAKNEDFVDAFEKNLSFVYYKDDLERIFKEAVVMKNKLLIVERKLKSIFADVLPEVVMRELADNLTVEDLSLE